MGKNESRSERRKAENNLQTENKKSLSKVYYWIIGILFLILFLLVFYIFAKSGNKVDLGNEEETSSIIQENEINEGDNSSTDETKEDSLEETTDSKEIEGEAQEKEEEAEDDEEIESEEEATEDENIIDEDAPLDTNYAVDYNSGSTDRNAIKSKVMQATGLGSDLIESWVANNGPGRVTADVHNPDKSKIYRVYLQYGDGDWHVTNYDSLSSIPSN